MFTRPINMSNSPQRNSEEISMQFASTKAIASVLLLTAVIGVQAKDVPADKFDLSEWNITLPTDDNDDSKPDSVSVKEIQDYEHPDFFYLDEQGNMVFTAPNKALTTANSTNTVFNV